MPLRHSAATARAITALAAEQRLDRIEGKIDKLSEAVVSIARAEEKLAALEADKKLLMESVVKIDGRLVVVEEKAHDHSEQLGMITRIFWITVVAVITTLVGVFIVEHVGGKNPPTLVAPAAITQQAQQDGTHEPIH